MKDMDPVVHPDPDDDRQSDDVDEVQLLVEYPEQAQQQAQSDHQGGDRDQGPPGMAEIQKQNDQNHRRGQKKGQTAVIDHPRVQLEDHLRGSGHLRVYPGDGVLKDLHLLPDIEVFLGEDLEQVARLLRADIAVMVLGGDHLHGYRFVVDQHFFDPFSKRPGEKQVGLGHGGPVDPRAVFVPLHQLLDQPLVPGFADGDQVFGLLHDPLLPAGDGEGLDLDQVGPEPIQLLHHPRPDLRV